MVSRQTAVRTPDGLHLGGSLVVPDAPNGTGVVLVHGGGVTREEGGFFTRLADGLAASGAASLRFDLRGHGESEGRQEDLTIAGILGDIRAALDALSEEANIERPILLGASFSGGICAYYAASHPNVLGGLIMFNPLLNYKKRFIDDKPYWHGDQIEDEAGRTLLKQGYIAHSPTFKLGRPLLNEVFYLRPNSVLEQVSDSTLIVHGTRDTFIPIESSRAAAAAISGECRLVEIDGAQHGFAVHDDPQYADPQTKIWQAGVIELVADWVTSR